MQEFKVKVFEFLFTDDSHVKIVWLDVAVFTEHDLLHFWDNVHSLYYPVKVRQIYINSFNYSNQTGI